VRRPRRHPRGPARGAGPCQPARGRSPGGRRPGGRAVGTRAVAYHRAHARTGASEWAGWRSGSSATRCCASARTRSRTSTVGWPRSPRTCSRPCVPRRGVGLAANQVGVLKRLFTWEVERSRTRRAGGVHGGAGREPAAADASEELQEGTRAACPSPGCSTPSSGRCGWRSPTRTSRGRPPRPARGPLRPDLAPRDGPPQRHPVRRPPRRPRRKAALKQMREYRLAAGLDDPEPARPGRVAARPEPALKEPPVRIAFLGTPEVAVPSLDALVAAEDIEVVVVLCNPDRPKGRSRTPVPPPVKVAAEQHGIRSGSRQAAGGPRRPSAPSTSTPAPWSAYGALLPRSTCSRPAGRASSTSTSRCCRGGGVPHRSSTPSVPVTTSPASPPSSSTRAWTPARCCAGSRCRSARRGRGRAAGAPGRGGCPGPGRVPAGAARRRGAGGATERGRDARAQDPPRRRRDWTWTDRRQSSRTWCAAPTRRPVPTRASVVLGSRSSGPGRSPTPTGRRRHRAGHRARHRSGGDPDRVRRGRAAPHRGPAGGQAPHGCRRLRERCPDRRGGAVRRPATPA
jgi:hypothetical protein